jgi:hypothetical protein
MAHFDAGMLEGIVPLESRDENRLLIWGDARFGGDDRSRAAKPSRAHALPRCKDKPSLPRMGTGPFENDVPSRRARVRDLSRNVVLLGNGLGALRFQMEQVRYSY